MDAFVFQQIAIQLGLSVLGMLAWAWFKGFTATETGQPNFSYFIEHNWRPFAWAVGAAAIIILISALAPAVADTLDLISGFNISPPISDGSAISLGIFLYGLARNLFKKKSA